MYVYKIETQGGEVEDMKFSWISWDFMLKFQGSIEKEVQFPGLIKECNKILQNFARVKVEFLGVPRSDQEKIMSNFHESWFFTLGFSMDVTQSYRISKCKEKFVLSRFSEGKVTNLKDAGFFYKEVCPQPNPSPSLDFSRIALHQ